MVLHYSVNDNVSVNDGVMVLRCSVNDGGLGYSVNDGGLELIQLTTIDMGGLALFS